MNVEGLRKIDCIEEPEECTAEQGLSNKDRGHCKLGGCKMKPEMDIEGQEDCTKGNYKLDKVEEQEGCMKQLKG